MWRNAWHVVRHPGGDAQRLTLIYAVGMFGQTCMSAVLALFLSAKFGITVLTIGSIFFYQNVFSVIMRSALLGPIVDRITELWSMRIGTIFLIVGLVGYPFAPNLWVLAAVIPLIPIGTALLFPATTALLSKATDAADYGTALGTAQTFAGNFAACRSIDGDGAVRIPQPQPSIFCRGRDRRTGLSSDFSYPEPSPEARASGRYGRLLIEVIR